MQQFPKVKDIQSFPLFLWHPESGSAKATFDCHCQRWAGAAGYIRSLLQETFNEKPKHRAKRLEGSSRQGNRQEGREQLLCHEPAAGDLAGEGVLRANAFEGAMIAASRENHDSMTRFHITVILFAACCLSCSQRPDVHAGFTDEPQWTVVCDFEEYALGF
jgi:hypothetical protein